MEDGDVLKLVRDYMLDALASLVIPHMTVDDSLSTITTQLWRSRGQFVEMIGTKESARGLFLLKETWDAFQHITTLILDRSRTLNAFAAHLRCSRFFLKGTIHYNALQEVTQIYADRMGCPFPSVEVEAFHDPDPIPTPPSPPTPPTPLVDELDIRIRNAARILVVFMEESFAAVRPCRDPPNKKLLRKLKAFPNRMDKYCPFREVCPSRKAMLGKLDAEFLKTQEGMFSLMIARGVTFACHILHTLQHCRFSSVEEFENAMEGLVIQEIRDNAAYGPSNGREPENAVHYWEFAAEWPAFLLKKPTFKQICYWFLKDKKNGGKKKQKGVASSEPSEPSHPPAYGPLTAYLSTVDLAYAGLCEMPTTSELGILIKKLGMGGLGGLVKLGLLANKKVPTAAVQRVFIPFCGMVKELVSQSSVLSQGEQLYDIDDITIEHALCKYSKCKALRWV